MLTPQEQEATKVMAGKLDKGAAAPPPPPPVPVAVPKAIDQATAERMKTAEREQFRKAASEARARAEKAAREAAEYRMKLYPDGPEARARRDKEAAETQKVRNISCIFWNRLIYFIDFTSPSNRYYTHDRRLQRRQRKNALPRKQSFARNRLPRQRRKKIKLQQKLAREPSRRSEMPPLTEPKSLLKRKRLRRFHKSIRS